jgi:hypothetical protein
MTNEKKKSEVENSTFTTSDLKYILDVNQKAVEIYVEVEKQNDQVLNTLEHFKEVASRIEECLDEIKTTDSTIEELLSDDNNHDHTVIIDMLKIMTEDIRELSSELKDLKVDQVKTKEALDITIKRIDEEVKHKISEIEKNLFRLVIILGSAGIGTIFTILQTFLHK